LKILNGFFIDVSRQMEKISNLENENMWLRACISHQFSGVIVVDVNKKIIIINKKAVELLDITEEKAMGAKIDQIIPSSFRNTYSTGGLRHKILHSCSGVKIPVFVEVSKVNNKSREPIGKVYMFYDIRKILKTEGKLVQRLQRTRKELYRTQNF
jgi:transcriptional regulator with PAS, ATPase and Fis domain